MYYFFDVIINIKHFDPNNIKIDKNSQKFLLHSPLDNQKLEILKN